MAKVVMTLLSTAEVNLYSPEPDFMCRIDGSIDSFEYSPPSTLQLNNIRLGLTAKLHEVQVKSLTHWRWNDNSLGESTLLEGPLGLQLQHLKPPH